MDLQPVEQSYNAGNFIIHEGNEGTGAFRILEGRVKIQKMGTDTTLTLATLEEGAVFGEMSLIDKQPYSATATAETDVRLLFIRPAVYKNEVSNSSPIIQELLNTFSIRLRNASKNMSFLADLEKKQRQFAELSQEEIKVITHLAHTGMQLQNVFEWESAYRIIRESFEEIGFKDITVELSDSSVEDNTVVLVDSSDDSDSYELVFSGNDRSGKLSLRTPADKLRTKYPEILQIYNGYLSSCLSRSQAYQAFENISEEIQKYISDTRINEVFTNFKTTMETFSSDTLNGVLAIPERLKNGENIEDISMELTMGFQEMDRLSQEIDLIKSVLENIQRISAGQIPVEEKKLDKNIDVKG
ncbi:MAG: cyclic nucleotide-binding domain-containing protein, partial [bacterium]|nr:cyclic nucleotide-binding domain-containing protein [bacterium]